MTRREFTKSTKLARFDHADGCCEKCGDKIYTRAEYDHAVPAAVGGGNEFENCRVLCQFCHAEKTNKRDKPEIAKTARIIEKRAGVRKPKGQPMIGTKASGWRKRMDGTVERRSWR
jgi:5-methylcytosine-specific restriction endonuclease McrA